MTPRQTLGSTSRRGVSEFDEFYRIHYARMVSVGIAHSHDVAAAQDLVQDSFLAAYRAWADVRQLEYPERWLFRVLSNKAVSTFRRLGSRRRAVARLGHCVENVPPAEPVIDSAAIWSAVRELPRRQIQVVVLCYVAELTLAEIGEVLGCSKNSVNTHLRRARATLARRLEAWR